MYIIVRRIPWLFCYHDYTVITLYVLPSYALVIGKKLKITLLATASAVVCLGVAQMHQI